MENSKLSIFGSISEMTLNSIVVLLFSIVVGVLIVSAIALYFYPKIIILFFERLNIRKAGFTVKSITTEDGYRFAYLERGSRSECKATVLFLHGFSGSKTNYCTIANYFPSTLHLISVDLPGHGDTTRRINDKFTPAAQVARVKEFVNAMKLNNKKFHLLGMSMGGNVAGVYAATHGEDLLSASLLCPAGVKTGNMSELLETYLKENKMYLLPNNMEEMKIMYRYVIHRSIPIPDLVMRGVLQQRIPHNEFFGKVLRDLTHEDHLYFLHERIQDIKCPTLVLWGKHDRTVPFEGAKVLREQLPNGTVHELDDCGHCINLERPRKATQLIMEFLESVQTKSLDS